MEIFDSCIFISTDKGIQCVIYQEIETIAIPFSKSHVRIEILKLYALKKNLVLISFPMIASYVVSSEERGPY